MHSRCYDSCNLSWALAGWVVCWFKGTLVFCHWCWKINNNKTWVGYFTCLGFKGRLTSWEVWWYGISPRQTRVWEWHQKVFQNYSRPIKCFWSTWALKISSQGFFYTSITHQNDELLPTLTKPFCCEPTTFFFSNTKGDYIYCGLTFIIL